VTTITIVTPWHGKKAELERDYFRAVFACDAEHLIVDDRSTPPLPNALRASGGFAGACNAGLSAARTDAVLFLNNDVVAHARDWIEPIRDQLEPGVLVGAELRNDKHGYVDGQPMPYLDGWCLAGMTKDLRDLGGFDETFIEPSYYGDNDLCFRARLEGMTLREARVPLEHLRNRTTGGSASPQVRAASIANHAKFVERVRDALGVAA
jgi:GT2 family glycosyltransferase